MGRLSSKTRLVMNFEKGTMKATIVYTNVYQLILSYYDGKYRGGKWKFAGVNRYSLARYINGLIYEGYEIVSTELRMGAKDKGIDLKREAAVEAMRQKLSKGRLVARMRAMTKRRMFKRAARLKKIAVRKKLLRTVKSATMQGSELGRLDVEQK